MTIDDYVSEWNADTLPYQNGDANTYIMTKHANIVGKWSEYLAREKKRLAVMEINMNLLKYSLSEYYAGELNELPDELERLNRKPNPRKYLKEKIPMKVATDKAVIEYNLKMVTQQEKIDFLNGVKKELEYRPTTLKTALEYRRFEGA